MLLRALYRGAGAAVTAALRLRLLLPPADAEAALRLRERLGRWQGGAPRGDWVWIHAASVGEARLAAALVAALKRALDPASCPAFVVTCQTATGRRTAMEGDVGEVHYFPVDYRQNLVSIVDSGSLRLFVSVETELWPCLLAELARRGIPTAIANGRISDASYPRYRRLGRLFAEALGGLKAVCARDDVSAARLVALGAPPSVVTVSGDIKFDLAASPRPSRRPLLARDSARPLLVAASTHEGEEAVVLEAFVALTRTRPGLRLVLVPRHPSRAGQAQAAARSLGLDVAAWSSVEGGAGSEGAWQVLVVDGVGRLGDALASAAAAFVGGSLLPGPGGHNLLEVVAEDLPAITGPYLQNVTDQADILREAGALTIVADAAALEAAWRRALDEPEAGRAAAFRARQAVDARRGALAANVAALASLLGSGSGSGDGRGRHTR